MYTQQYFLHVVYDFIIGVCVHYVTTTLVTSVCTGHRNSNQAVPPSEQRGETTGWRR